MPRLGDAFGIGLPFYYLTSLIVIVAVVFAVDFVPLCTRHPGSRKRVDLLSAFSAWDGEWYAQIASAGYSYDPERMSSVAFFPLYPSLAGALVHTTGMRAESALLVVSHGALIGLFVLLVMYVRQRFPGAGAGLAEFTVLAMGLFPTTFYFRMTYTESVFLLVTLLALYGMERHWGLLAIASIIGLATAARTVGVALVPVFGLYLWQRLRQGEASGVPAQGPSDCPTPPRHVSTLTQGARRALGSWLVPFTLLLPVCCWGLLGYVLFQWVAFNEPLAFVKTQAHWNERPLGLQEQLIGAVTLEPIRAVYDRHQRPPAEELYDLREDPVEFHNLAGEPECAAVQEKLRAALQAWREQTSDPLLDPTKLAAQVEQSRQIQAEFRAKQSK